MRNYDNYLIIERVDQIFDNQLISLSSPEVGSSNRMISEFLKTARAISILLNSPPEKKIYPFVFLVF